MTSIGGGVSSAHNFMGLHFATTPQGFKPLDNQNKDIQGNKYLTAGQRHQMMADGYKKAHGFGNQISDSIHRNQAAAANARAQQTYSNAAANGNITRFEQRQINGANRDAKIANKQVEVDTARTHLGNVERNAARDGKITPWEQTSINSARGNLSRLEGELGRMKSNDRRLDARDARLNTPGARMGSAIQDAFHIGRNVGTPAPQPWTTPARLPDCRCGGFQVPGSGATSGRIGSHIAMDNGHLRFTNSNGVGFDGTKYLNSGERFQRMQSGADKAQFKFSDSVHQHQASQAQQRLSNAYANAGADGFRSNFEQRDINAAQRDVNIANKQVSYDTQRRHVGNLERQFAADGKITTSERQQLQSARQQLGAMGAELRNLRRDDARMDRQDAAVKNNPFAQFANNMGVANHHAQQFMQNFQPMRLPMPSFNPMSMIGGAFGMAGQMAGLAGQMAGVAGGMMGATAGMLGQSMIGGLSSGMANIAGQMMGMGTFANSMTGGVLGMAGGMLGMASSLTGSMAQVTAGILGGFMGGAAGGFSAGFALPGLSVSSTFSSSVRFA